MAFRVNPSIFLKKEKKDEKESLPLPKNREEDFKYKPSLLNPNMPNYLVPTEKVTCLTNQPEKEIIVYDKINKKWIMVKQAEGYKYKF